VRRSLNSTTVWLERFSILSDRQIALAFADMVARPSADHSVVALAQKAGLSRSAFMARFVRAIGCSPMVALRQMRMKRAADMLAARTSSVEQIARAVGYRSCSSFLRAFRQVLDTSRQNPRVRGAPRTVSAAGRAQLRTKAGTRDIGASVGSQSMTCCYRLHDQET
ncbi:MAG: helix-turn-helix domain-containing protein, partial [Pseudolabrys sp.]